MLSEIAISDEKSFANLVDLANKALAGTLPKEEKVDKTTKTETKKEVKEEKDLTKMTVAELKEMAKAKNIEGYTSMKKAELLDALK